MFKKSTRLTIEILMAIITALLLVVAIFFWRLSQGPMAVPSFNRQIESSLSDFSQEIDITVEQTILQWGGFEHPLSVHILGVKALNQLGGEIGAINEVSLNLSLPDLLLGQFVPTHINIIKPSFTITRQESGVFDINARSKETREAAAAQNLGEDPLEKILEVISDPRRQGVVRKLQSFTISNAEIFYQDIPGNFIVTSPNSDIELNRDQYGIEGVMTLNANIGGMTEALRGQIDYDFATQKTTLSLKIDDFNPNILARLSTQFERVRNFDVPLTGILNIEFNNIFQILSFNLVANADAGKVNFEQFYPEPLTIDQANLDISYNPNDGSVYMKQFAVDIDGFKLDVKGRLTQAIDEGLLTLEAKAGLFNIQADQLAQYWPEMLASGAYRWVTTNISDGFVPKATADIKLIAPVTDITLITTEKLSGTIFIEGATVDYLKPMPPVKNVNAFANFTKDLFSIETQSGVLRDTNVQKGKIDITGFDKRIPDISIDMTIEGPLSDSLYVIGSKPLELTKEIGLDHDNFTGRAKTNLSLSFPLSKNLPRKEVNLQASSVIKNVKGSGIITDLAVTSDELLLEANNDRVTINGQARLADIPITLDWREEFGDQAQYMRRMTASGQIGAADIQRLAGIDISDYIASPFQASATIQETKTRQKSTAIDLDLKNTAVSLPLLHYSKPAGQEARAKFEIVDGQSGVTTLQKINLQGPDLSVKGEISLQEGMLSAINLNEFKNNGTDATIAVVKENNRYEATVRGASLDVSDIWQEMIKKSSDTKKAEKLEAAKYPALALVLDIETLRLTQEQSFEKVKAVIELKPDYIHRMEMDAIAGRGDVYLRYTPFENGPGHQLRFETPDAGAALTAFGLTNKIAGGLMIVDAASAVNEPDLIVGGLTIKDYKVVKAPILGRLLNALSPVGLVELLNNEGINFLQLESKWYYKNDILTFQTGRMAGSSLGLNYEGPINLATNYMDIKGTIVPVDPVNRVIGTLPVVGQILGGTKGEGLFAATYEIKGYTDDPKVTLNPLAALAPGILRTIFFEGGL